MLIASRNRGLRERLVDAAHAHPRVHLVGTLRDISDARTGGPYPDVVMVGGGEPSLVGARAVSVARELFPSALLVPVADDDEPDRILDFAQRAASGVLRDEPGATYAALAVQAAIDAGEPTIVFQPILDLLDRRVIGVEALARFSLEPRQPPDRWFAAAHLVGLGIELERAALTAAVSAARGLPPDVHLAVNVSPAFVLDPDFADALAGVRHDQLVLEITEHAEVDDYDALRRTLATLRASGVRVAIDDVGAGFASLRHVLRLEPEIIKLDQEITRGVEHDDGRAKLVGGLIAGASAISTLVVAEGIENEAQLARLRELGVRGGQGYLLARPTDLASALAAGAQASAALPSKPATAGAPTTPRHGIGGARILIVDDSTAHRLMVRSVFELEGAAIHEAGTVTAAIGAFDAVEPDIVLLDLRLPDGSGFDVLEHVRRSSNVPVLFLTSATAISDRIASVDQGADDYMLKPCSPRELIARVDTALRRRFGTVPNEPERLG